MKEFLAIYTGTPQGFENWQHISEADRKHNEQAGMKAWKKWEKDNGDVIVDVGTPIGKTKRVSKQGIEDCKNTISAYAIVQAETLVEAARLFENHPHFTYFPGEAVEVMECLPMPEI